MRILAVIPARGGSKGLPGKNIRPLAGKPLLAYTAEAALASNLVSQVVLSTDDLEIAHLGRELGLKVPFIRPPELALDHTPTLPVIQHALRMMEAEFGQFDAVCILQVTSPFRKKDLLDQAISKFIHSKADSLVTVLPVPDHFNPHWTFEPDHSGLLQIATGEKKLITRRQELPKCYHRDGSIYITKREVLIKGSLYGDSVAFLENDPDFYVNIDTQSDWDEAERIIAKIKNF